MLLNLLKIKKKRIISFISLSILLFLINMNFGLKDTVITIEAFTSFILLFSLIHVYNKLNNKFPLFIIYHIGIFIYYVLPTFYFKYLQGTWLFNTQILQKSFSIRSMQHVLFMIIIIQIISLLMLFIKKRKNFSSKNNSNTFILKKNASVILFVFVLILLIFENIINIPILRQVKVLMGDLLYVPIGLFLYQYLKLKEKKDLFFLVLTLGIISLSFLTQGAAAPFAELGVFIIIILYIEGVHLKIWHYIAGLSIISFVMLIKMSFRALFWAGSYSIADKISGVFSVITSTMSEGSIILFNSLNFLLVRAQTLSLFIIVTTLTPSQVPYMHLSQIKFMFWSFIPRFIIPFKPVNRGGQAFGHAYSIIGAHDFVTAVNIPSLIGFYLISGLFTLILGVVFFNWIMLKVEDIYKKNENNQSVIIAIAYFSVQFIHSLDTGFVGIGNYIYKSIIIYFVCVTFFKFLFYNKKSVTTQRV